MLTLYILKCISYKMYEFILLIKNKILHIPSHKQNYYIGTYYSISYFI